MYVERTIAKGADRGVRHSDTTDGLTVFLAAPGGKFGEGCNGNAARLIISLTGYAAVYFSVYFALLSLTTLSDLAVLFFSGLSASVVAEVVRYRQRQRKQPHRNPHAGQR